MLIFFKLSAETILSPKMCGEMQFRFLHVYSMKCRASAKDFQSSRILLFSWKISTESLWRITLCNSLSYSTPPLMWWAPALPLWTNSSCVTLLLSDIWCSWKGVQRDFKNKYFGINNWNNCFYFFSAIFCAIHVQQGWNGSLKMLGSGSLAHNMFPLAWRAWCLCFSRAEVLERWD